MDVDHHLTRFYEGFDEHGRLRRPGRGDLVRLRTWDLFDRFLPPGGTVADVGGATGTHAAHLADTGHDVLLVDPLTRHVEAARAYAGGRFRVEQADARSLPLRDRSVDAVVLMGPLYHLVHRADRVAALREALRVLRPGGVLMAEVISRYTWVLDATLKGLLGDPGVWTDFDRTVGTGLSEDPAAPRDGAFFAYFHRVDELPGELAEAGFRDTRQLAVEGFAWLLGDLAERMREPAELLRAVRLTEAEPSMLGVSSHVMGVARRAT